MDSVIYHVHVKQHAYDSMWFRTQVLHVKQFVIRNIITFFVTFLKTKTKKILYFNNLN